MLLRKLVAALCPVLLCLLACALFGWLDSLLPGGSFFLFVLKGLALGIFVALVLPAAGISTQNNGLMPWLFAASGVLALLLVYQYLETIAVVSWPILGALISINGQVVLVEGAFMGFLLLTGILGRRR